MTNPEDKDRPSLEDELLGPAAAGGDAPADRPDAARSGWVVRDVRAEPRIRLPGTPPWERYDMPARRDIGWAVAGFLTFAFIDGVMMYAPLMGRDAPTLLPQMVTLLVLAFGLGGLLVWHVRGAGRPFGIGMMMGWVFLTLISAGYLTGVMSI